jgi:pimeloyl-ACP methyl ester carboxylesterase
MDGRAREWFDAGSFFEWSPGPSAGSPRLQIFNAQFGDPEAPPVLLVHGFPTSSVDWFEAAYALAGDHRVCVLDFPGFGFSDKPQGHRYRLELDRDLVEHYLSVVLGVESVAVVAHDRGDSVTLALVDHIASGSSPIRIERLVLTNGNIFLPLSNLTTFQRLVLDAGTASDVLAVLTPGALAAGMGMTTFTPPRSPPDPVVEALAQTFAHNDGLAVLHDTIQYLVERAENEQAWLEALAGSPIPTALVWGLYDTVSPFRVAAHVWEAYLSTKPGDNELWLLPGANHYLQCDQPEQLVTVIRLALAGESPPEPGAISGAPDAPVLLDRSRAELPTAASVLAQPASVDELRGGSAGGTS